MQWGPCRSTRKAQGAPTSGDRRLPASLAAHGAVDPAGRSRRCANARAQGRPPLPSARAAGRGPRAPPGETAPALAQGTGRHMERAGRPGPSRRHSRDRRRGVSHVPRHRLLRRDCGVARGGCEERAAGAVRGPRSRPRRRAGARRGRRGRALDIARSAAGATVGCRCQTAMRSRLLVLPVKSGGLLVRPASTLPVPALVKLVEGRSGGWLVLLECGCTQTHWIAVEGDECDLLNDHGAGLPAPPSSKPTP